MPGECKSVYREESCFWHLEPGWCLRAIERASRSRNLGAEPTRSRRPQSGSSRGLDSTAPNFRDRPRPVGKTGIRPSRARSRLSAPSRIPGRGRPGRDRAKRAGCAGGGSDGVDRRSAAGSGYSPCPGFSRGQPPEPPGPTRCQPCEATANDVSELPAGIAHDGPSGPAPWLLPEPPGSAAGDTRTSWPPGRAGPSIGLPPRRSSPIGRPTPTPLPRSSEPLKKRGWQKSLDGGQNGPSWPYPGRPVAPDSWEIGVPRGCSSDFCHPRLFRGCHPPDARGQRFTDPDDPRESSA